jgi:hypothetical protein
MKHVIQGIVVVLIFGLTYVGFHNIKQDNQKIELQKIQLQSTDLKLKKLQTEYADTIKELEQHKGSTEQLPALQQRIQELEKLKADLERQLQAKKRSNVAYAAQAQVSGSCADWIAQAGIQATGAVLALIGGESGCRPNAINPSSGACGIPQALPCAKMGCSLSDPVCQLKWMNSYVHSRYGSWENAYATWQSRSPHWY